MIYTVAFFGHKHIEESCELEKCLDDHIYRLLSIKYYVKFLVGCNGEFDQLASSAVHRMRRRYRDDNSALVLVVPDITSEYINNIDSAECYYSEIEVCTAASTVRPKYVIHVRNWSMIERADLILCYITHQSNTAWRAVQYAIQRGKLVINLAEAMVAENAKNE